MSELLRKPMGRTGHIHHITPETARSAKAPAWSYVGFDLHRLEPGETVQADTGDREAILVLVEGKARIAAAGQRLRRAWRPDGRLRADAAPLRLRPERVGLERDRHHALHASPSAPRRGRAGIPRR